MRRSLEKTRKVKPRSRKLNGKSSERKNLNKLKILLPLTAFLIILIIAMSTYGHFDSYHSSSDRVIKVLIYNGTDADPNCVLQTETILSDANDEKNSTDLLFEYNTSDIIDNTTLTGYDVLYMPGSESVDSYLNDNNIDEEAIKNFINSGKGYVGICGGAYAAVNYIDGWGDGWGIAPNVNAEEADGVENLTIESNNSGEQILENSDVITISHYNGPAFYGTNYTTFASYADDSIGYQGYAAIVGDYYGNGRVILSGVHPELTPRHPEILINLITWAANA